MAEEKPPYFIKDDGNNGTVWNRYQIIERISGDTVCILNDMLIGLNRSKPFAEFICKALNKELKKSAPDV